MSTSLTKPPTLRYGPPTPVPHLIYGTAWKGERTACLVHEALRAGFRAIDTAAQPRHYREDLVGQGIRRAIKDGIVSRSDIYIQTKFTPVWAQDPDFMPYDEEAELEDQVRQSVEGSLRNFDFSLEEEEVEAANRGAEEEERESIEEKQSQRQQHQKKKKKKKDEPTEAPYIDCLILHSPMHAPQETLRAWTILSSYVPHSIRHLGISNTPLQHLTHLITHAPTKPSVVQNRLVEDAYQPDVYAACLSSGIVFQAFSALTGNPNLLAASFTERVAVAAGVPPAVALYALLLGLDGWTVLDGTTRWERMVGDLEGVEKVGKWRDGEGSNVWEECFQELKWEMGIEW